MIRNANHPLSVVRKMEMSNFDFYLTGSRFFGGDNSHSDWDYFVTDSRMARDFLFTLGFIIKDDTAMEEYLDSTICTIMERNDVQIQLVKDAVQKNQAQTFLAENCNMRAIPKEARRHVWNLALKMVRNGVTIIKR